MGYYGMALGAATLVGYGISGTLVSVSGYNLVFYTGALLLLVGVFLASWMPRVTAPAGTGTQASFQKSSRKVADLVKRRGLIVSYCSIFAQYFTFGGLVTLLPLYLKGFGMSAFHFGMLLTVFVIVFILFQLPTGSLSDRTGRKLPITIGLCLCVGVFVLLPLCETFIALSMVMALYGVVYALIFPSSSALLADNTSAEERGTATGIFHALLTGGVALGAPIIGWTAGQTTIELGLMISGAVALAAVVAVITAWRMETRPQASQEL